MHNLIKDNMKSNMKKSSTIMTDFHCINLNGYFGYSVTYNKTETGVLDGTRLYFLVGKFTRGDIACYEINGHEYWCQMFGN